jgi:signal transduction histidine kinase
VREVVLIGGRGERDALFEARARRQLQDYGPVTLRYLVGRPLQEVLAQVSTLDPKTALLFLSMEDDGAGHRLDSSEALLGILRAARAPLYALRASQIEADVVGGRVADGGIEGEEIAAIATRVLRGEDARQIPIRDTLGIHPVASSRALRRWGLSEARLPAGTVLVHENPTLWDRYAAYVVGAALLIAVQAGLIVTLVAQHARRRETEARNHAILRAVPDLMFLQDCEGRYLDYHAPNPESLLLPPEQFLGRPMRDVLPGAILAAIESAFTSVLEKQEPATVEYAVHIGDEERRYEARLVPHEHRRVLSIVRDVTDRHRAEMALRDAHADLVRVSKLAALGEFAASIAHEVRQPLTAIVTNARTCLRWLKGSTPDVGELRMALLDIVSSGNRAEAIVTRNRELFRHRRVQKRAVDINRLILETEELAQPRIQAAGASLRCALEPELPYVLGDRLELQQVLLNLIVNGVEAMEDVDRPCRRVLVVSTGLHSHDGVLVTVSDDGSGLDGVDLDRIFAPGYTTKAGGTGFGLSVSRTVIEAHGGRMWAAPNAESGATFGFTVPVAANGNSPGTACADTPTSRTAHEVAAFARSTTVE